MYGMQITSSGDGLDVKMTGRLNGVAVRDSSREDGFI
jgi:hypothetical protein